MALTTNVTNVILPGSLPQFTFTNYTVYNYIGITNDGKYLFLNNDNRIDIFDATNYTLIKSITGGGKLRQPIFSKNGNYVYYVDLYYPGNSNNPAIFIIDAHLLTLVEIYNLSTQSAPPPAYAIYMLSEAPTSTISTTSSITPLNGFAYYNGVLSNDDNYLYVFPNSAYFYAIYLQNGLPTGLILTYYSLSGYPLWYVGFGNNGLIYALGSNSNNTQSVISVIDPSSGNIITTITVYNGSSGSTEIDFIYFIPNSNIAYVRDSYNSNMYIINTLNNTLITTNPNYWGYYTSTSDGSIVFSAGPNLSLNVITPTSINPIITITFGSVTSYMPAPYLPMVVDPTNTYIYTLYNVGYMCCVYDTPVLKIRISDYSLLDLKTYKWTVYINKQENGPPVCGGTADYILSTYDIYSLSVKLPNGNYYYIVCPEPSFIQPYSGNFTVYYNNVTINVPLLFITCGC
ncbi:MAG: hypothetical protein QW046_05430 [Candidatus Micrarchaeaceae archaeon]